MNELRYEELIKEVSSIPQFKKLVQSESKRPIAVRLLRYVANISEHEAWDFIDDYYSNMDINFKNVGIQNANFDRRTIR